MGSDAGVAAAMRDLTRRTRGLHSKIFTIADPATEVVLTRIDRVEEKLSVGSNASLQAG